MQGQNSVSKSSEIILCMVIPPTLYTIDSFVSAFLFLLLEMLLFLFALTYFLKKLYEIHDSKNPFHLPSPLFPLIVNQ